MISTRREIDNLEHSRWENNKKEKKKKNNFNVVRPQPTSMGQNIDVKSSMRKEQLQEYKKIKFLFHLILSLSSHWFTSSLSRSHLTCYRLYIVVQTNPNTAHNLVVSHTTEWSRPKKPIRHKVRTIPTLISSNLSKWAKHESIFSIYMRNINFSLYEIHRRK